MTQPYEIHLVVTPTGDDTYTASLVALGTRTPDFPLTLPFTPKHAADLRWYIEEYLYLPGAGDEARAMQTERDIARWGWELFDALFGSRQGTRVQAKMEEAIAAGRPCTLTIANDDPIVLAQPWEMMHDEQGPLVLRNVTIRRQLTGVTPTPIETTRAPLRVLLIVSRPSDISFIDPRNSIAPLFDVIDALPPGLIRLDFCDPPTLATFEHMMRAARTEGHPYHIVHFDGHGNYSPHKGMGTLAFEHDDGQTDSVSGSHLGALLSRAHVPLVLLEACRTSTLSSTQPVAGSVAPALLKSGVGSVIAFSHSVHIRATQILVERFYDELLKGESVGRALEEARAAMLAKPARFISHNPDVPTVNLYDWFIPQLYQIEHDPVLMGDIEPDQSAATPHRRDDTELAQRMHGFPPEPLYRFHGRAPDLLHLERALRKAPAVLLAGMGGMGKTALARESAHWWLRTRRYEAAVFVSFEQRPSVEQVVQTMGAALAGDDFSARPAEEQRRVVVQQFRQRRVLVVWDNYESVLPAFQQGDDPITSYSAEERREVERLYRALTEGDPAGRLLLTCRPATLELPRLRLDELGGLQRPDSLRLLQAVLEQRGVDIRRRPDYERPALDALLDMLDDHPLSVELVAPHLARHPPAHICEEFGALLDTFQSTLPDEERNRSLRASLEFSKRHLSAAAQAVLPWLAWFSGGVFEISLLAFMEMDEHAWATIRAELVNTALVRVEPDIDYIRLHPTLPYAARPDDVPDADAAELRFIAVYVAVMREADNARRGSNPAFGMALLHYEETNFRAAMRRTFQRGERQVGWALADTLGKYLQMGGRQREQVALSAWVREQMGESATLDEASCASFLEHAWGRCLQDQAQQAVDTARRPFAGTIVNRQSALLFHRKRLV